MLRHLLSDALLKSDLLRQGDALACALIEAHEDPRELPSPSLSFGVLLPPI